MPPQPGRDRSPSFGKCDLCGRFQFRVYRFGNPDRSQMCCWPCVIVASRYVPPKPLDDQPKGS